MICRKGGQTAGIKFTHRGDSLNRFNSNLAGPTGTWVRLAVQNFTSIGAGVGMRPQNIKHFHFLVKSRRGEPLDRFLKFLGAFMHTRDCIDVHLYCSFSLRRQVALQQSDEFRTAFLLLWGRIESPIMHRFGRCFRHLLEDQNDVLYNALNVSYFCR